MKTCFALIAFLFPFLTLAQSFESPESVEYDVANSRWLVGNHGSGEVLVYSPGSGTLTPFCSGMTTGPYGIEILGNVLYCCDGGRVKGYNLDDGSQVFNLNLNASFLNGITSDGVGNLFVTDFSAKKIYRIVVSANAYNLMATIVKTPNGVIYDGANNRLVYATWGSNAAVQALSLADSTVSTLATTTLGSMDGIMRDPQGNWYVSTWSPNALHVFDPAFSSAPTSVLTGLSSPADLGINAAGDSIAVPNSGSQNNVEFYAIPTGCIAPSLSAFGGDPTCAGDSGFIGLSITGGTPPYDVLWSNGTTAALLTATAGNYTVTVTDSIGCTASLSGTVLDPPAVNISFAIIDDTQGFPDCTGIIEATISNGTAPFAFTWSNGMSTDSLSELCIGWYFVTVTDNDGCSAQDSAYVDFINGINDVSSQLIIGYPNPASEYIALELGQAFRDATLTLVDARGRTVLEQIVNGTNALVDVSTLAYGSYVLVINNNNRIALRQKFVVAR